MACFSAYQIFSQRFLFPSFCLLSRPGLLVSTFFCVVRLLLLPIILVATFHNIASYLCDRLPVSCTEIFLFCCCIQLRFLLQLFLPLSSLHYSGLSLNGFQFCFHIFHFLSSRGVRPSTRPTSIWYFSSIFQFCLRALWSHSHPIIDDHSTSAYPQLLFFIFPRSSNRICPLGLRFCPVSSFIDTSSASWRLQ